MEPTPERCARLRAHKALPRRRVVSDSLQERKGVQRESRRASDTYGKDVEITSWIANASPTSSNPNLHLPLTPPSLSNEGNNDPFVGSPPKQDGAAQHSRRPTVPSSTPVNQNTPPTPDLTPPHRNKQKRHDDGSKDLRYPSSASQADSFMTAREYAASENGTTRRSTPEGEQHLSASGKQMVIADKLLVPKQRNNIGLGLGLDLDERNSSSTMRTLRAVHSPETSYEPNEDLKPIVDDDPFTVSEPAAVRQMALESLSTTVPDPGSGTETEIGAVAPDEFQSSIDRAFLLRHRIDESRKRERPRTREEFDEDAGPSLSNKSKASSPDSLPVDSKRVSQLSTGSSAVVEAVVFDTPRPRRRKLRHSSKNASLRDAGSPISGSNRSSLVSGETKPRVHQKTAALPVNRNRTSLNSDSGISMGFEAAQKEQGQQASEVPKRMSSLRSSSRERRLCRPAALDQRAPGSSRPTTAPDGAVSRVIASNLRSRSMSDSGSLALAGNRGRELRRSRPSVPPRTSSLSAPTSRTRREAALRADDQHLKQAEPKPQQSAEKSYESSPRGVPEIAIEHDDSGSEDQHGTLKLRPSLTRTPFSAVSAASFQSSTPGPVEFNEATAISIHPHNNNSVLVVQHSAKRGSEETRMSAHLTNNVTVELRGRPDEGHPPTLKEVRVRNRLPDTKSQAAHPRPAVMLIPPTPANAPEADGYAAEALRPKRKTAGPFSSIRRALSARRYSDTVVVPCSSTPAPRSNGSLRRRIKLDSASKALSPFWRPRGFWDDFDSESGSEEEIGYVRNTLGLPQTRVIAGPVALARRLGSLKRKKEALVQDSRHPTTRRSSLPSLRFRSRAGSETGSLGSLTRLRPSFELRNPFLGFYYDVMKKKAVRDEVRYEKEREKLKRSIGPALPRTRVFEYQ